LAQAQKLNPTEQKIAQYIDAHFAQTEQLLKDAVNINSGTLNTAGVKQVGDIFKKEFEKIGFATTWVNLPDSLKRAGHLVAEKKGKQVKSFS
jgi:glutamate carboxypeptidase